MKAMKKTLAGLCAVCISTASLSVLGTSEYGGTAEAAASKDISSTMEWDTLKMGGAGFVSGIVAGKKEMYLRTDVGGAYRYDYDKKRWVQLFGFINEDDR